MRSLYCSIAAGVAVGLNIGLAFKNFSLGVGVGLAIYSLMLAFMDIVGELREISKKLKV